MEDRETTGPGGDTLRAASSQYRMAAGLPERESDEPTNLSDPAALTKRYEPEGGYGGEGGIRNTAATNASEQGRAELREEQLAAREEGVEETGLTGGETATEVARVTGEDVVDVKPAPGHGEDVVEGRDEDEDRDEEK